MFCDYGCGREAKHQFKNGKWCCEDNCRSCPEIRKKYSRPGNKNSMFGKTGKDSPNYGKPRSEETKRKISEANKGKHPSEESRRKMSEAHKGEKHHMFGKHLPEETRRKMSEALRGEKNPMFGKKPSKEHKKKLSESHRGKYHSEETKKKLSELNKGKHHSEETKRKISELKKGNLYNLGKHHSEEAKRKMSIAAKKNYQNEEYCRKRQKSHNAKPNKKEIFIKELLDSIFPGDYTYTGDFSFMVGGKNPDFVNEEEKKIIEFFGDRWHTGENIKEATPEEHEQNRINHFKKHGYDTLIIWGHELKDLEKVSQRICDFQAEK
jgi:hypothetical protein